MSSMSMCTRGRVPEMHLSHAWHRRPLTRTHAQIALTHPRNTETPQRHDCYQGDRPGLRVEWLEPRPQPSRQAALHLSPNRSHILSQPMGCSRGCRQRVSHACIARAVRACGVARRPPIGAPPGDASVSTARHSRGEPEPRGSDASRTTTDRASVSADDAA